MSVEYSFDGTNIKFRFTVLDASGLVPQAGITSIAVTAYGSDKNEDAVTETVTEVAQGVYEASIPYADINRALADGLWTFVPSHTNPDLVFRPPNISILINVEIGTATGTPTTTSVTVSGLKDVSANHYKESYLHVLSGSNIGESKKISASADAGGGNVTLTVSAMSVALAITDKIMIINR